MELTSELRLKFSTYCLKPSYVGEGKGIVQVLWERGFIDVNIMKEYKQIAKDKVTKKEIPDFSLLTMLKSQPDFANEVS